ncbi:MAG: MFS transporter [Lachnospiraceae bacterium]|nr:MFS transporter [Lachnospiraceae bacterium]
MALAIKRVPAENKSTAMGLFQALYGIGMTLGPVTVGRLADARGYSFAYAMFAVLCVVAAVLAGVMLPGLERERKD